jgi:hypothetical protein
MENLAEALLTLMNGSPTVLALLIAFAAVAVAGLALYVVLRALPRREK